MGVAPGELKLDLGSSSPPPPPPAAAPGVDETTSDDDDDERGGPDGDYHHHRHQQAAAAAVVPGVSGPSLRAHVAAMAKRFVDDGRAIRRSVLEHFHRFTIRLL